MRTPEYIVTRCFTEQTFDGTNSKDISEMIFNMFTDMARYGGRSIQAAIDLLCMSKSSEQKIEGFHFFFGEEVYRILRQRAGELFDIRSITFMRIPYTVCDTWLMNSMTIKLEYTKPSESYKPRYFVAPPWKEFVTEITGIKTKDRKFEIKKVIFNDPATIVFWKNGDKTVVKCQNGETFDQEKGLAMAIAKRALGTNDSGSNYNDIFKWHIDFGGAYVYKDFKNEPEQLKTCGRCIHIRESGGISGSSCYLCSRNPVDHRIDWFEEKEKKS